MKAILSALTIITGLVFMASCIEEKTAPTTEIVVLRDITDKSKPKPNVNELTGLLGLKANSLQGAIVAVRNISDVSYTSRHVAELLPENKWMVNEFERANDIKKFSAEIATLLAIETVDSGKAYSSIYLPLARELNEISKSKSDKRILLLYSDLMENTPELSFYKNEDFELLKNQPDLLLKRLEKELLLNPLGGIEIHFIFQPKDNKSDKRFQIISEFYKRMFEQRGATVIISANLN